MVHPLIHNYKRSLRLTQMTYAVLCKYSKTIACNQLRNSVINLRIQMIRTPCKYNTSGIGIIKVFYSLFTLSSDILCNQFKFKPRLMTGNPDLLCRNIREFLDKLGCYCFL